jgi:hypothetical protein
MHTFPASLKAGQVSRVSQRTGLAAFCQQQSGPKRVDFFETPASNALEVPIHSSRRFQNETNLHLPLSPLPRRDPSLRLKVTLHISELFDDGLYSLSKAWTGEIGVDLLALGFLTFTGPPCECYLNKGFPQGDRDPPAVAPVRPRGPLPGRDAGCRKRQLSLPQATPPAERWFA